MRTRAENLSILRNASGGSFSAGGPSGERVRSRGYDIVKEKHQNEKVVECLEFEDFFAFFFIDEDIDDNEEYSGAYCTVQKKDGKLSTFNPTSDFEAYFSAKRIDVEELRKMQW